MPKNTYVLMHGGLKLTPELAEQLDADLKHTPIAPQGARLSLDDDFVKQVDPKGVQFVSEATYDALVAQINAQDAAEASIAEKRAALETEAQRLTAAQVNAKLVAAVRSIEAAKKAPKPAKPDTSRPIDTLDEPVKKPKKAPKPAKGA